MLLLLLVLISAGWCKDQLTADEIDNTIPCKSSKGPVGGVRMDMGITASFNVCAYDVKQRKNDGFIGVAYDSNTQECYAYNRINLDGDDMKNLTYCYFDENAHTAEKDRIVTCNSHRGQVGGARKDIGITKSFNVCAYDVKQRKNDGFVGVAYDSNTNTCYGYRKIILDAEDMKDLTYGFFEAAAHTDELRRMLRDKTEAEEVKAEMGNKKICDPVIGQIAGERMELGEYESFNICAYVVYLKQDQYTGVAYDTDGLCYGYVQIVTDDKQRKNLTYCQFSDKARQVAQLQLISIKGNKQNEENKRDKQITCKSTTGPVGGDITDMGESRSFNICAYNVWAERKHFDGAAYDSNTRRCYAYNRMRLFGNDMKILTYCYYYKDKYKQKLQRLSHTALESMKDETITCKSNKGLVGGVRTELGEIRSFNVCAFEVRFGEDDYFGAAYDSNTRKCYGYKNIILVGNHMQNLTYCYFDENAHRAELTFTCKSIKGLVGGHRFDKKEYTSFNICAYNVAQENSSFVGVAYDSNTRKCYGYITMVLDGNDMKNLTYCYFDEAAHTAEKHRIVTCNSNRGQVGGSRKDIGITASFNVCAYDVKQRKNDGFIGVAYDSNTRKCYGYIFMVLDGNDMKNLTYCYFHEYAHKRELRRIGN